MTTDHAPSFADLGVPPELVRALAARGITEPFPIQAAALPDALAGRDVLGRGRTGSGKTVAFALPVLDRIMRSHGQRRPHQPAALVLVPTRELAIQVAETFQALARPVGLRVMTVFGGVRYTGQVRKLERGVDVVIATPGRLEDLLEQRIVSLDSVSVVVLDEADLMADMGFLPPVTRILAATPPGQRMLFSATLDDDVQEVVDRFLHEPLVHDVDAGRSTPEVVQHLFVVAMGAKRRVLTELVTDAGRTMLFTRTRTFAEGLAAELNEAGIPSAELHGNLRQGARQRNLSAFADGSLQVLVATDIAARGIHVDGVGLVIHVDPPMDPKAFLHRSGRTARAGAEGRVVTLATPQQARHVRRLMAAVNILPVEAVVAPGDPIISEVRAARASGPVKVEPSIFAPDPEDFDDEQEERFVERNERPEPRRGRPERDARKPREERGERTPRQPREERAERTPRNAREAGWRDAGRAGAAAQRRADAWAALDAPDDEDVEYPTRRSYGTSRNDESRAARGGVRPDRFQDGRDERPGRDDRPRRDESPRRDDRPGRDRDDRPGRPARPAGARGSAPKAGARATGPRSARPAAEAARSAAPAASGKKRWSDEDRTKRQQTAVYLEATGLKGRKSKARAKAAAAEDKKRSARITAKKKAAKKAGKASGGRKP